MNLYKFDIYDFGSNIKLVFKTDDSEGLIVAEVSGDYRSGSNGNNDAAIILAELSAYYLNFEPLTMIIDLSRMNYSWGNTLLKVLNLFKTIGRNEFERELFLGIVYSEQNKSAIASLIQCDESDLPENYFDSLPSAYNKAQEIIKKFLDP